MSAIHPSEPDRKAFLGAFVAALLSLNFLIAGTLITAGLFMPAFRIEQFWIFHQDVSVLGGIQDLIDDGQSVLGWLLLLLSVVIPLGKTLAGLLITMFARDAGPLLERLMATFDVLGKLSFTDVFVIAILVIVLDGRVLTAAQLGPGIYAYASGVALSWLATIILHRIARRALSQH